MFRRDSSARLDAPESPNAATPCGLAIVRVQPLGSGDDGRTDPRRGFFAVRFLQAIVTQGVSVDACGVHGLFAFANDVD